MKVCASTALPAWRYAVGNVRLRFGDLRRPRRPCTPRLEKLAKCRARGVRVPQPLSRTSDTREHPRRNACPGTCLDIRATSIVVAVQLQPQLPRCLAGADERHPGLTCRPLQ